VPCLWNLRGLGIKLRRVTLLAAAAAVIIVPGVEIVPKLLAQPQATGPYINPSTSGRATSAGPSASSQLTPAPVLDGDLCAAAACPGRGGRPVHPAAPARLDHAAGVDGGCAFTAEMAITASSRRYCRRPGSAGGAGHSWRGGGNRWGALVGRDCAGNSTAKRRFAIYIAISGSAARTWLRDVHDTGL
jgi:hypothetical protein